MRLWSIDPKYLDKIGLVALWREGLLAKKVLENKTTGYKNHPQLERFKNTRDPLIYINFYLQGVLKEAQSRGYKFSANKISQTPISEKIPITSGQLEFETRHLQIKLSQRSPVDFGKIKDTKRLDPHQLFEIVPGPVASWEKTQYSKQPAQAAS